jgi:hypothetical protein
MSTSNTRKFRKPRHPCQYTAEERKVFQRYKEEYRSQTTKERRGYIFKTKILPDLFNYWTDDGAMTLSDEEAAKRVKVCGLDEG